MIERLFHARSNFLGNSNRLLVSQALVCKNVSRIDKYRLLCIGATLSVSQTAIL